MSYYSKNYIKITKREWYARGGFRNSHLTRNADKRGVWAYYWDGKTSTPANEQFI